MADTRQIVSWSLERKCPFRNGVNWALPDETCKQLADLQTFASAAAANRVVDGICVTGWTSGKDNSGEYHDIPCNGFRIEERIRPFGALETVRNTCGKC